MNFFKSKFDSLFGKKEGKTETSQDAGKTETSQERSKQEAQAELVERFQLRKTSDFQLALQKGQIEKAQEWLNYIDQNKADFPQYHATWESWLADREADIKLYQDLKADGSLEKMKPRSKEEAQRELRDQFGFFDTRGFRRYLETDPQLAKAWLKYIVDNKLSFPQYLANWDNWLSDRERELSQVLKDE